VQGGQKARATTAGLREWMCRMCKRLGYTLLSATELISVEVATESELGATSNMCSTYRCNKQHAAHTGHLNDTNDTAFRAPSRTVLRCDRAC
jgi:hypothetical protein